MRHQCGTIGTKSSRVIVATYGTWRGMSRSLSQRGRRCESVTWYSEDRRIENEGALTRVAVARCVAVSRVAVFVLEVEEELCGIPEMEVASSSGHISPTGGPSSRATALVRGNRPENPASPLGFDFFAGRQTFVEGESCGSVTSPGFLPEGVYTPLFLEYEGFSIEDATD